MKKILRLVTTSVLTLTLVACGEASSSVASSTPATSGSVSSPVSSFANVTGITISAASNTLNQVVGATQTVSVVAAINANTNPNLALEWYVNGVKSQQTGRVFEFVPTTVGAVKVQAKSGNVSSNELTVNLALPTFTVTSAAFVDASQIKIVAPAGAKVTLTGATLADTSKYDIALGAYILDLKSAAKQGDQVTVRLERDGNQALSRVVIFDTQLFELENIISGTELLPLVGGVYQITKPSDEDKTRQYTITLNHKNLLSTVATAYSVKTTVPTGATAVADSNDLLTGVDGDRTLTVDVTDETVVGLYTHTFKLGNKTVEIKVQVLEPVKQIELLKAYNADLDEDFVVEKYEFITFKTGATLTGVSPIQFTPIVAGADGVFEVVKPFTTDVITGDATTKNSYSLADSTGQTFEFKFKFDARFFPLPEISGVNNRVAVTLEGPSGFGANITLNGIPLEGNVANESLFNNTFTANNSASAAYTTIATSAVREVVQKFDRTTLPGLYTFTITAGEFGNEITKQVKVRIVEPKPELNFVLDSYIGSNRRFETVTATNNTFVIEKPLAGSADNTLSFFAVLKNYHSAEATSQEIQDDALVTEAADKKLFTSVTTAANSFDLGVLRLGSAGVTAGSIVPTATQVLTGAAASNSYNYVNFSLGFNGPSPLITPIVDTKLAILLANDKDSIIVYNRKVAESTPVILDGYLAEYALDNAYDALDAGYTTASTPNNNKILNGAPLTISSLTVPGNYTLTFRVDDLVEVVNLIIREPAPALQIVNSTLVTDVTVASGLLGPVTGAFSKSDEVGITDFGKLEVLRNSISGVTFVPDATPEYVINEEGVFTVLVTEAEMTQNSFTSPNVGIVKSLVGFVLPMEVVDLPLGDYNYSVVKTYPDGSVERFSDLATINTIVEGVATDITNLRGNFNAHWQVIVDEVELGTYTFEFTFGPLSRKVTVVIAEQPKLTIKSLFVGSSETVLFNGIYRLQLPAADLPDTTVVSANIELNGLLATDFYRIKLVTEDTSVFTFEDDGILFKPTVGGVGVPAAETAVSALISLEDVETIILSNVELDVSAAGPMTTRIIYEISFFTQTPVSVNLDTGVISYTPTQVGETQEIIIEILD